MVLKHSKTPEWAGRTLSSIPQRDGAQTFRLLNGQAKHSPHVPNSKDGQLGLKCKGMPWEQKNCGHPATIVHFYAYTGPQERSRCHLEYQSRFLCFIALIAPDSDDRCSWMTQGQALHTTFMNH